MKAELHILVFSGRVHVNCSAYLVHLFESSDHVHTLYLQQKIDPPLNPKWWS